MKDYESTVWDHDRMVAIIEEVLSKATSYQKHIGWGWYWNAHRFAQYLSKTYGYTMHQTCAVIAVLSPNNRWKVNMTDAEAYMRAAKKGERMPSSPTYPPQRRKAWGILHIPRERAIRMYAKDFEQYIGKDTARKTKAFYWNILDPTSRDVTVDSWMYRGLGVGKESGTPKQYQAVVEAVTAVADKYKCTPSRIQAVFWIYIKDYWEAEQEQLPF